MSEVVDEDSVSGWVDEIKAAFGAEVPHQFTDITYAGNTPTTASGITFQLLVKASRSDADSAALVDAANGDMTITTAPLVVGYDVDTNAGANAGFSEGATFPAELWVDDMTYGRHLVKEWQIKLSDPIKSTFP